MQNSKQYLKDNNILPKISFKDREVHRVVLIKDKLHEIPDDNNKGKMKKGVKYMVTEGGEPKTFFTASPSLIQKLAEFQENDEVDIEMKSKKIGAEWINFYEVNKAGEKKHTDADDDDIPVLDEDAAKFFERQQPEGE